MKSEVNSNIKLILVWLFIQLILLSVSLQLWNWVMPSIGVPKINLLQMSAIYCLYKLFCYDWVNQYNLNSKTQSGNEK